MEFEDVFEYEDQYKQENPRIVLILALRIQSYNRIIF